MRVFVCIAVLLYGCGPALTEQVRLRTLADKATADCKREPAKTKKDRCEVALVCAQSADAAVKAIQTAQEARAAGGASWAQDAAAKGAYAASIASCKAGGWK
jgi:predicted lactoylglutathione lyase